MAAAESRQLSPLQIKRALNRNIVAGSFGMLFATCLSLQFVTEFAIQLGATKFQLGLLTSLPLLTYPFQLLSAYLIERIRRRKRFWFILSVSYRLLWVPMTAIPFLVGKEHQTAQIHLFLFLLLVANALAALTVPPWFSWMADLVPPDQAGRFWNRRTALLNAVMLSSLCFGHFVDLFPKGSPWPFVVLFGFGVLVGELDLLIHYGIPEPPMKGDSKRPNLLAMLKEPVRDPRFRRYLVFNCTWSFAATVSNAFVMVFFLETLRLSQFFISVLVSVMLLTRIFMARYWGFLADRFGHTAVNTICDFCLILVPMGYIFVTPANCVWLLIALHIWAGVFNVGLETANTALMLSLSTSENKSMFVAVLMSMTGIVAAVAPLLGGWILHHFEGVETPFMLWRFDNFQMLFLCGFLLRLVMFPFSLRLDDIGGGSTALVVRRLMDGNPLRVIRNVHVLSDSSAEVERVSAVQELASARSSMATRELVQALDDPSLDVRQEAVLALARIGDHDSVDPLIRCLRSAESGTQPAAAYALGKLRDPRAAPALLEALTKPALAHSAATALGEIGDPAAIGPLLHLLRQGDCPEATQASAAHALSRLGEFSALPDILAALQNTQSKLVRQQLALAIGTLIGNPGEFYNLLTRERRVIGQEVARVHARVVRASGRLRTDRELIQKVLALIETAHSSYGAEQWREACHHFARAGLLLAGSLSRTNAADSKTNVLTDWLHPGRRKMAEQLVKRGGESAPLWLLLALTFPQSRETLREVTQEESLLAFYAFWRVWVSKTS